MNKKKLNEKGKKLIDDITKLYVDLDILEINVKKYLENEENIKNRRK